MVGPYDVAAGTTITVYYSSNALAAVGAVVFLNGSVLKAIGTGTLPIVLFNGGSALAFSRDQGSAICKSTDNGKTWNGYALINSNFGTIMSSWVSPDGSRVYALVNDAADTNLWRLDGAVWQRIAIIDTAAANTWLVRGALDDANVVFIGNTAVNTIYKSSDAGDTTWTTRAFSVAPADFVVQDANTIYMVPATSSALVFKSVNGGFLWPGSPTGLTAAAGGGYSLNLSQTTR